MKFLFSSLYGGAGQPSSVGLADERLLVRGGVNAAHRTLPTIWSARDKRRAVRGARHRFSSALGAEGSGTVGAAGAADPTGTAGGVMHSASNKPC
ncbi:MAG TPA: hypothetical protein P5527_09830 [Kiritimatiellia bacterium]|nr:hypothetical protein [Kiritimatiellia bacterium]